MLFYFDLNKNVKIFLEITDHYELIGGSNEIEFRQDGLNMLKMRCPISGFFKLVLEILSKLTLDIVYKSLGTSENFLEEGFKLGSYN